MLFFAVIFILKYYFLILLSTPDYSLIHYLALPVHIFKLKTVCISNLRFLRLEKKKLTENWCIQEKTAPWPREQLVFQRIPVRCQAHTSGSSSSQQTVNPPQWDLMSSSASADTRTNVYRHIIRHVHTNS